MKEALDIISVGAVTPIGLNAFQTAAAFRARITGFRKEVVLEPPLEPLTGAKIPVHYSLRTDERQWLVNMAARAVSEALQHQRLPGRMALILTLPETHRAHPYLEVESDEELVASVAGKVNETRFAVAMSAGEGSAGIATALTLAREMMRKGTVDACVVGGVDSMLNRSDVARLLERGRILTGDSPKGLIPGEGSAALLLVPASESSRPLARIYGVGAAVDGDPVTGERLSQGRGFEQAVADAVAMSGLPESSIKFRVSTLNGEHYAVWESMFYALRAYRTRRQTFPVWYTASSVGETGAAAGAIAMVVAALGIAGGYAPGARCMCESASETGLRGACFLGPATGQREAPFRAEEGASGYVWKSLGRDRL